METIYDLLFSFDNYYSTNEFIEELSTKIEFLSESRIDLFDNLHCLCYRDIKKEDYLIFLICLELYSITGFNHFTKYHSLIFNNAAYKLYDGIEGYLNSPFRHYHDNPLSNFKQLIEKLITDMHFFKLDNLDGISIDKYQRFLDEADENYQLVLTNKSERNKSEKEILENEQKERYFQFQNLDINFFEKLATECIDYLTTKQYDLDSSSAIYTLNSEETFLIMLFNNEKPVRVGISQNPLIWLNTHQHEVNSPKYNLLPTNKNLSHELLVYLALTLNIHPFQSSILKIDNKVYCTINKAKKMYPNINLKDIKKLIAKFDLWNKTLGSSIVIKKHELDEAIKKYI